jgi:hypothetical protein
MEGSAQARWTHVDAIARSLFHQRALEIRANEASSGSSTPSARNSVLARKDQHTELAHKEKNWQRNAPNPGGGVGREKRVMRMVPGGKPAPQTMSFG